MLQLLVLLDVLEHPVAAHVVLMATGNTEESTMIADNGTTELGNVVLEVYEVLALLVRRHIVKVNVLVAPFEVMNDTLVSELLFDDEDVLEEVDDALLDIEVVELSDHGLLVLEVLLVLVDQRIPLIDNVTDIVEDGAVCAHVHLRQLVGQVLVLLLLTLQFAMHVFDLHVVAFKLAHNELLINATEEMKTNGEN